LAISIPIAEPDRFYKVDRVAFFMVDVDSAKVIVAKVTAPINTWKPTHRICLRGFWRLWRAVSC